MECIEGMTLEDALSKDVEHADTYQWANPVFEAARERLLSTEAKWIVEYSDAVREKTRKTGTPTPTNTSTRWGNRTGSRATSLRVLPSTTCPASQ